MADGKKSVDEALKAIQEQSQAALVKAKTEQDAQKEKDAAKGEAK
ncbi:hypothetical protein [Gordoniibacillus kamchatkensis]|nr:hypothetical protein [Paenibacillus sp. VKM B-2647]